MAIARPSSATWLLNVESNMKIKRVQLRDFKRFTDLTIEDVPESAKLVLLVGPNGSGKSSLIEALHVFHRNNWRGRGVWDLGYHPKQGTDALAIDDWGRRLLIAFHGPDPDSQA